MNPHIRLVDDEAPIREMLGLHFRKRGYEASGATDTAEALRLVGETKFDLVILDVNVAGENGLELLATLKRQRPALPIIMFTGLQSDEDLLAQSLAAGADGFIRNTDSLHELFGEGQRFVPAPQDQASSSSSSRKPCNWRMRVGWRIFRKALASIWRMRSRVT